MNIIWGGLIFLVLHIALGCSIFFFQGDTNSITYVQYLYNFLTIVIYTSVEPYFFVVEERLGKSGGEHIR